MYVCSCVHESSTFSFVLFKKRSVASKRRIGRTKNCRWSDFWFEKRNKRTTTGLINGPNNIKAWPWLVSCRWRKKLLDMDSRQRLCHKLHPWIRLIVAPFISMTTKKTSSFELVIIILEILFQLPNILWPGASRVSNPRAWCGVKS